MTWTEWIHENINNGSNIAGSESVDEHLSIEVILGWSSLRITAVVLIPVLLSIAIGVWFQWNNSNDLTTVGMGSCMLHWVRCIF
jgi:hypothetical protein